MKRAVYDNLESYSKLKWFKNEYLPLQQWLNTWKEENIDPNYRHKKKWFKRFLYRPSPAALQLRIEREKVEAEPPPPPPPLHGSYSDTYGKIFARTVIHLKWFDINSVLNLQPIVAVRLEGY